MRNIFSLSFILIFCYSYVIEAKTVSPQELNWTQSITSYSQVKDVTEISKRLLKDAPESYRGSIGSILATLAGTALPQFAVEGPWLLVQAGNKKFKVRGWISPDSDLKAQSHFLIQLEINSKKIGINFKDPQADLMSVVGALEGQKTVWHSLLMPQAHAALPMLVAGGAAVLGAAYTAYIALTPAAKADVTFFKSAKELGLGLKSFSCATNDQGLMTLDFEMTDSARSHSFRYEASGRDLSKKLNGKVEYSHTLLSRPEDVSTRQFSIKEAQCVFAPGSDTSPCTQWPKNFQKIFESAVRCCSAAHVCAPKIEAVLRSAENDSAVSVPGGAAPVRTEGTR